MKLSCVWGKLMYEAHQRRWQKKELRACKEKHYQFFSKECVLHICIYSCCLYRGWNAGWQIKGKRNTTHKQCFHTIKLCSVLFFARRCKEVLVFLLDVLSLPETHPLSFSVKFRLIKMSGKAQASSFLVCIVPAGLTVLIQEYDLFKYFLSWSLLF